MCDIVLADNSTIVLHFRVHKMEEDLEELEKSIETCHEIVKQIVE